MVRELGDCGRQRREGDGNAHGDTSVTSQQRVCSDGQGRWAAERDGRGIRTRYHESRFGEQEVGRRESIHFLSDRLIYVVVIILFVTLRDSSELRPDSRVASRVGSRNKSTVKLSTIFPTQPLTEPTFGASINHDFPLIITVSTVNDTRRDHDTASEFTTAPNSVQEIK
ncbi:hypothetical protein PLEOSDRAFT_1081543 [Pleurotus ostreatus PC15]|uniref:Uncharacterized protein n=1 Tax=Pleurotus ostreatus (strain PC15) TaxID=1137138 RepID=A0A067NZI1_PLEO1|nr:hypothetical protein PLEOSDRAFT_1081543 [Pleurotus ostreatus PC15]